MENKMIKIHKYLYPTHENIVKNILTTILICYKIKM